MSSAHTVMTYEVFHSIDSSDLSSLSSQDKFQFHLWKLYITMSTSPKIGSAGIDLDFNQYLTDALLSFESRESPVDYSAVPPPHPDGITAQNLSSAPHHPDVSNATNHQVDDVSNATNHQVDDVSNANHSDSPIVSDSLQLIIDKKPKDLSEDDFLSLKDFYNQNIHLWNNKALHKSCKVSGLQYKIKNMLKDHSHSSSNNTPKSSKSPKSPKSPKSSHSPELLAAREKYFTLFGKKAGRMKLENILKKIAQADTSADTSAETPADTSADTSADNSSVKPEDDPEATQDVYPDDLEPDENEYSKYIHEGVEYLHDTSTDQLIGSDNRPWANIETDGSVTFLSQEFIDMHQVDGDYEAPDCDDDTEIEDNDC